MKNIQQPSSFNVLLIGDDCIDEYHYGFVDRISPEAPVPIFKFISKETKPGMAANVKANLEALGCNVTYIHGKTSVKTRLIDRRSKQHIVRIDNDIESNPIRFDSIIPSIYDAVIISDYEKGTVDSETIEQIKASFKGPIFIDTKKTDLTKFNRMIIKINKKEYNLLETDAPEDSDLIVTCGDEGAFYREKNFPSEKVEVADVCGAGDTFLSALCYKFLQTSNLDCAIKFAIKASSLTVQKLGVYAPSLKEIT